jgi:hypothetical protein
MEHIKYEERFVSLLDDVKDYRKTQLCDTCINKL